MAVGVMQSAAINVWQCLLFCSVCLSCYGGTLTLILQWRKSAKKIVAAWRVKAINESNREEKRRIGGVWRRPFGGGVINRNIRNRRRSVLTGERINQAIINSAIAVRTRRTDSVHDLLFPSRCSDYRYCYYYTRSDTAITFNYSVPVIDLTAA